MPRPKVRKKHGARTYIYALVFVVALIIIVNGALFILGLTGISISPATSTANGISMTLDVPNESFVPIDGRIVTHVYDAHTNQLIGSSDDPFHLTPSQVNPVRISIAIAGSPSDQIRVTMDYYIGAYGVLLPFPIRAADVTLPAP